MVEEPKVDEDTFAVKVQRRLATAPLAVPQRLFPPYLDSPRADVVVEGRDHLEATC